MASSPPLSPAQHRRIRSLSQPRERAPGDGDGEINVVPFLDIIVNVLMFVLATLPALLGATITSTPAGDGHRAVGPQRLHLAVIVSSEGISLKTIAGHVGPGCAPGVGVTIPKRDGAHDFAALARCAALLKEGAADPIGETSAQLLAEPGVDYQTLVTITDALRETRGEAPAPLFPDVSFGVAR